MAEKSSFMGEKIEFQGKKSSLSFLVKSSFPQNAQKKPAFANDSSIPNSVADQSAAQCPDPCRWRFQAE